MDIRNHTLSWRRLIDRTLLILRDYGRMRSSHSRERENTKLNVFRRNMAATKGLMGTFFAKKARKAYRKRMQHHSASHDTLLPRCHDMRA